MFSYDSYSRLACARQASTTCSGTGAISYLLDPFGRASSRTKGSSVTSYTYRGIEETLAKTVQGSTTMTYAATPSGTPLAQQKNSSASSTRYFLSDPHSDLVGLVSASAASKGTVSFDPWGTKLSTSGTETSVLGFQSDLTDPDSALVDMGTRWYVPSLGRFTSRDVLFGQVQAPVSLNMSLYAGASPVSNIDPTGMVQIAAGQFTETATSEQVTEYSECRDQGGTACGSGWEVTDWSPDMADASVDPEAVRQIMGQMGGAIVSSVGGSFDGGCGFLWYSRYDDAAAWAWDLPNDAAAAAYRGLATLTGAECEHREGYWACTGGDSWVTGFGVATTVGDTIVGDTIDGDEDSLLSEGSPTLAHELAHVVQAQALGPMYLPFWFMGAAFSARRGKPSGECNPMEIAADLMAGTDAYGPCPLLGA